MLLKLLWTLIFYVQEAKVFILVFSLIKMSQNQVLFLCLECLTLCFIICL